jgi:hypothetical protein
MTLLAIIDGAGPSVEAPKRDGAEPTSANETERKTVQESEQQNTTKTVETVEEQGQTSTSPKCTFARTAIPIDLKRFTDSGIAVVECPDGSRTRSLSPIKGVLRFPPHEPRKIQTNVSGKRWAMIDLTWKVGGGEQNR